MKEKLKILVVDDYAKMRESLSAILKGMNHDVVEADNGFEALTCLRKESFDVVFTDIVMPEMDGFELCEEIRRSSEWSNMPIVVVSTHCDTNYIVKALRFGADDYIPKPVEPAVVEQVLARILTPISMD